MTDREERMEILVQCDPLVLVFIEAEWFRICDEGGTWIVEPPVHCRYYPGRPATVDTRGVLSQFAAGPALEVMREELAFLELEHRVVGENGEVSGVWVTEGLRHQIKLLYSQRDGLLRHKEVTVLSPGGSVVEQMIWHDYRYDEPLNRGYLQRPPFGMAITTTQTGSSPLQN